MKQQATNKLSSCHTHKARVTSITRKSLPMMTIEANKIGKAHDQVENYPDITIRVSSLSIEASFEDARDEFLSSLSIEASFEDAREEFLEAGKFQFDCKCVSFKKNSSCPGQDRYFHLDKLALRHSHSTAGSSFRDTDTNVTEDSADTVEVLHSIACQETIGDTIAIPIPPKKEIINSRHDTAIYGTCTGRALVDDDFSLSEVSNISTENSQKTAEAEWTEHTTDLTSKTSTPRAALERNASSQPIFQNEQFLEGLIITEEDNVHVSVGTEKESNRVVIDGEGDFYDDNGSNDNASAKMASQKKKKSQKKDQKPPFYNYVHSSSVTRKETYLHGRKSSTSWKSNGNISVFDRLHGLATEKQMEGKKRRDEIALKQMERALARSGEIHRFMPKISVEDGCDIYYRGIMHLVRKDRKIAQLKKAQTDCRFELSQLVDYYSIMKKKSGISDTNEVLLC